GFIEHSESTNFKSETPKNPLQDGASRVGCLTDFCPQFSMIFDLPDDSSVTPAWASAFAETVCACFNEIEGSEVGFDYRYCAPGTQSLDEHLFAFGPQPLETSGGPEDGEEVVEPLSVDIDAVQQLFTHVESTEYNSERGGTAHCGRHLAVSGQVGTRTIT